MKNQPGGQDEINSNGEELKHEEFSSEKETQEKLKETVKTANIGDKMKGSNILTVNRKQNVDNVTFIPIKPFVAKESELGADECEADPHQTQRTPSFDKKHIEGISELYFVNKTCSICSYVSMVCLGSCSKHVISQDVHV